MSFSTKIINFVGGPGSGKTAMCSLLFAELKMKGRCVEYIPEIAKTLVWTKEYDLLNNQHYVSMRQYELLKAVVGKVEYILTDGPLLHGIYYNRHNQDNFCDVVKVENMILKMMNEFDHIYIHVVKGDFHYEHAGRLQTEEESIIISMEILNILKSLHQPYIQIKSGKPALDEILRYIDSREVRQNSHMNSMMQNTSLCKRS